MMALMILEKEAMLTPRRLAMPVAAQPAVSLESHPRQDKSVAKFSATAEPNLARGIKMESASQMKLGIY
jgi:hypothetical protein